MRAKANQTEPPPVAGGGWGQRSFIFACIEGHGRDRDLSDKMRFNNWCWPFRLVQSIGGSCVSLGRLENR